MANSEFVRAAIEAARKLALRTFAGRSDLDDKVVDAMRNAWQDAKSAGPAATVNTVANFAVTRAGSARSLGLSVRSIDHPRNRRSHRRASYDISHMDDVFRLGEDPAVIVQVRLDVAAWIASLSPRNALIAVELASGAETWEVAKAFNLTPGRISQLRKELMQSWQDFTA